MKKLLFIFLLVLIGAVAVPAQTFERVLPGYRYSYANRVIALPNGNWASVGGDPIPEYSLDSAFVSVQDPTGNTVWVNKRNTNHFSDYFDLSLLPDQSLLAAGYDGFHTENVSAGGGQNSVLFFHGDVRRLNMNGQTIDHQSTTLDPFLGSKTDEDQNWWVRAYQDLSTPANVKVWKNGHRYVLIPGFTIFKDFYPLQTAPQFEFMRAGSTGLYRCLSPVLDPGDYSSMCDCTPVVPSLPFVRLKRFDAGQYGALTGQGAFYTGDGTAASEMFPAIPGFNALDFDLDNTFLWIIGTKDNENTVAKIDRNTGQATLFAVPGEEQVFTSIAAGTGQVALGGAELRRLSKPGANMVHALPLLKTMGASGTFGSSTLDVGITDVNLSNVQIDLGVIKLSGASFIFKNFGPEPINGFWLNRICRNTSFSYGQPLISTGNQVYVAQTINPGETYTFSWTQWLNELPPNLTSAENIEICYVVSAPNNLPDFNHENDWFCLSLDSASGTGSSSGITSYRLLGNPVKDNLVIELTDQTLLGTGWKIYDAAGRLCGAGAFNPAVQEQSIDVQSLASGVYFLKFRGETLRFVRM